MKRGQQERVLSPDGAGWLRAGQTDLAGRESLTAAKPTFVSTKARPTLISRSPHNGRALTTCSGRVIE